jgi:hypothetical protein
MRRDMKTPPGLVTLWWLRVRLWWVRMTARH